MKLHAPEFLVETKILTFVCQLKNKKLQIQICYKDCLETNQNPSLLLVLARGWYAWENFMGVAAGNKLSCRIYFIKAMRTRLYVGCCSSVSGASAVRSYMCGAHVTPMRGPLVKPVCMSSSKTIMCKARCKNDE